MNIKDINEMKEMIEDPRLEIKRYPKVHRLWVLTILAFEHGQAGLLPPLADCAATLGISLKNLKKTLHKLNKLDLVHETPQGWVVNRLQENQPPAPLRIAHKRHASAAQRRQRVEGSPRQAVPYYD